MQRTTWRNYIVVLTLCTVIALPFGEMAAGAMNLLAALAGVAAIRLGVRRWRPEDAGPWHLAATGSGLFALGLAIRAVAGDTVGVLSSVADGVDLTAYLALAAMIMGFVRKRTHDRDPTNLLDALIALTGAFSVVWALIVFPYLTDPRVSTNRKSVESVFIVAAFVLGAAVARLAIGPGARNRAYSLLAVGATGALAMEAVISFQLGHNASAASAQLAMMIAAISLTAVGAAALHPEMTELTRPADEPVGVMSPGRLVLLLAALTTPGIFLIPVDERRLYTAPIIASWVLTGLLIVWRMSGLLRARERAGDIEFVISRTAAGLVTATERSDLMQTAAHGILQIAEAKPTTRVLLLDGLQVHSFDATRAEATSWTRPEAIDLDLAAAIASRSATHLFGVTLPDGAQARSAMVVPLVSRDHRHGTVVVAESDRVIPHQQRDAIINICADLALALETANIAEAIHRARSERRFRSLVDNAVEIIAVVDEDHQITFVSPAIARVLGYREHDVVGTPFTDLVYEPSQAAVLDALREHRTATSEVELCHADGTPRWFDVVVGDLRSDPEIRGFVITARDVTERRNAAVELQHREARFRALVQNLADGIALVAENGIITWVTPTLERMIAIPAAQLIGHRIEELIVHDDRERYSDLERRARHSLDQPVTTELRFPTSSGVATIELTLTDQRREPAVGSFVATFHDVTMRKQLEDDLRHQALHDALTGLPNRTLFHDRVAQALRKRTDGEVAVLLIDLDDFQTINDAVGHSAGDTILQITARRLASFLRDGDTIARLGGDEFAIVLEGTHDREFAYRVANRILNDRATPTTWSGLEVNVHGSVGVVFSGDCNDPDAEIMLRNADMALYAAKRAGKGRMATFTAEMHEAAAERLLLKADLEHAVELDQLVLHYQPIVDLRDRTVRGFEALMRWDHPTRGLVSPGTFIPLAEETGAIVAMGRRLMEIAFTQLAIWNAERSGLRPLHMSINLSPRQLEDPAVADDLRAALCAAGLTANLVTIEITESSAIEKDSTRHDRLNEIAATGVGIAADDFGTGYASYAALSHLPFTGVKLDRSLTRGLAAEMSERTTAQVRAILSMAELTGLSVVAEGIETEDELAELRALGCVLGQGFLLYRPMPAAAATALARPSATLRI